jgi:hypothetical protein
MPRNNGGWPHLPLTSMSDIELLLIFDDATEGDGGATAVMVAEKTSEGVRASRAIGSRFAWLARWGWMEQDKKTKKWYLTPEGEQLRAGVSLTNTQRAQVERLGVRALGLGEVLGQQMDPEQRRMLRRQLRFEEVNA